MAPPSHDMLDVQGHMASACGKPVSGGVVTHQVGSLVCTPLWSLLAQLLGGGSGNKPSLHSYRCVPVLTEQTRCAVVSVLRCMHARPDAVLR
jgi:hypothetical protein